MSSWVDSIAAFVGGFVNGFAQEYSSPAAYAPSAPASPRGTFQNMMRQLASHFGAEVHWDEDGELAAALIVRVHGSHRMVLVFISDGKMHLATPSTTKFAPGCLPRDVENYLAHRNDELSYADWGTTETNGKAYFSLKGWGSLDGLTLGMLKEVISKMLVESVALDIFLRRNGYAG